MLPLLTNPEVPMFKRLQFCHFPLMVTHMFHRTKCSLLSYSICVHPYPLIHCGTQQKHDSLHSDKSTFLQNLKILTSHHYQYGQHTIHSSSPILINVSHHSWLILPIVILPAHKPRTKQENYFFSSLTNNHLSSNYEVENDLFCIFHQCNCHYFSTSTPILLHPASFNNPLGRMV